MAYQSGSSNIPGMPRAPRAPSVPGGGYQRKAPSSTNFDMNQLLQMAGDQGPSVAQRGVNFLKGALDLLDRPRNAFASAAQSAAGQSPDDPFTAFLNGLTGQNHVSYGDILKKAGVSGPAANIGGFAGDVVLDPLNLVGLGEAAKAVKVGEGVGKVALNGAGRDFLQKALTQGGGDVVKTLGEDTVRNNVAKLISQSPELYNRFVDKGGIKIAGKSIVPGKMLNEAASAAANLPVIGKPLQVANNIKNAVADNFKVGNALDRAGGERLHELFNTRMARAANADDLANHVSMSFKNGLKQFVNGTNFKKVEDVSNAIARMAEEPGFRDQMLAQHPELATPLRAFQSVMGRVAKNETQLRADTKGAGLLENYRPHLFKEDQATVDRVISDMERRGKMLSPQAFFLKHRDGDNTVQQIVDHANQMGVKLTPLNAHESIAARLAASEKALANHEFVQGAKGLGVDTTIPNQTEPLQNEIKGIEANIAGLKAKEPGQVNQTSLFPEVQTKAQTTLNDLLTRKQGLEKAAADINTQQAPQLARIEKATASGYTAPGIPQLKGVLFPSEQAKALTQLIDDSTYKKAGPLLGYLDKAMGFYKGMVTQPFGSFHLRNKLGNLFNGAYLGGVGLSELPQYMKYQKEVMTGAKQIVSKTGRTFTPEELQKLGVMGSGQAAQDAKSMLNPITHGRQFGTWVENPDRVALFMNRIDKGDSVPQAVAHVNKFLFNYGNQTKTVRNIGRFVPFFCVPTDHKILTKRGFKSYDQLIIGEAVMALDHQTHNLYWTPLEDVAVFDYDGELKTLMRHGRGFEFTPDHRWPVERQQSLVKGKLYGGERSIVRTHELKTYHKIPLTGNYQEQPTILSPRHAAILGWLVTDGYHRWRGNYCEGVIYQSPQRRHYNALAALVDTSPRKPHPHSGVVALPVSLQDMKVITQYFKHKSDLPEIVTHLSRESAEAMWQAMMDAEGSRDLNTDNFAQQGKYGQYVLESFQILTLMVGKTCNIAQKGAYIRNSKYIYPMQDGGLGDKHYKGKIWCPKTKYGTWIVWHDGAMIPTGNTWTANNIPLQLEQMMKQPSKFNHLYQAFQEAGGNSPDMAALPSYTQNGLQAEIGSHTDSNNNKIISVMSRLGLPAEDLQKLYSGSVPQTLEQTGLASLAPYLQLPAEIATQQDFYRGMSFKDAASLYGNKSKNLPQPIKDWLGYKEQTYTDKQGVKHTIPTVDPQKYKLLESSPFYRFFNIANAGNGKNPSTGQDVNTPMSSRAGDILKQFIVPASVSDYNVTAEQQKRDKEAQQRLIDYLVQQGVLKQYTNTYKPKNK